jgi:cystathionine gamma-synthase
MKALKSMGFTTRALHADGHEKPHNAHSTPIFQTSTFYFDSPEHGARLFAGEEDGHIYTRIGNPTVETYERVVADLEGAEGAVAFSSGLAAIYAAIMSFVGAGDHVVSGDTLYGPSVNLIGQNMKRLGIESTFVDTSDLEAVKRAIGPQTRVVFCETPANPTCRITDIAAVAERAHAAGAMLIVDGTFATPYLQRPLALGADLSVHSTTKYINGHGDVVGGIVSGNAATIRTVRKFRTDTGACPSPMDAFLSLRGVRTLALRMEKHDANALQVARFLAAHPKVSRVYYHGLPEDPGHAVARRQMTGFGSTLSFELVGGRDAARELLRDTGFMTLAVSLGTLDTLIQHPASMTHASVPEHIMRQQGLTPEMVRLHVGLEDVEDILAQLAECLGRL